MILVLDNRDSFTFNLVQALGGLGAQVQVLRAEQTSAADVLDRGPERIVIGPGPGGPAQARTSLELLGSERGVPILGVCLGHQCLAHVFGACIAPARRLLHGSVVPVLHDGTGLFHGIPSPADFMRYNSLSVDPEELPRELEVTARSVEGELMGLRHRTRPLHGVQFHPESFLSEYGRTLLANFLEVRGG